MSFNGEIQRCMRSERVQFKGILNFDYESNLSWVLFRVRRYNDQFGPDVNLGQLCKEERLDEAFQAVDLLNKHGISISRDIIYSLLQGCNKRKDLLACRRVYSLMISNGLDSITVLGDHLIRSFTSCWSLQDANKVFCELPKPSIYTWNAIISAHANLSEGAKALELFQLMEQKDIKPDKVTFLCILKACSSIGAIQEGKRIHEEIIRNGLGVDRIIMNTLVDMYAKCGNLDDAHSIFNKWLDPDVVSWGAMIAGYVQHGLALPALDLFEQMQQQGIKPSNVTYFCSLKASGLLGAVGPGRVIHNQLMQTGLDSDVILGNALVDMYSKCGNFEEAHKLFEKSANCLELSWAAMIGGYVTHGHGCSALELFKEMQKQGLQPNAGTFSCILKACGSLGNIEQGRLIHGQILLSGIKLDLEIGTSLIDMYTKSGKLEEARKVFDSLSDKDVVSWGAMLTGYAALGHDISTLKLFEQMSDDIRPDKAINLCILKSCANLGATEQGRLIHNHIIRKELELDVVLGSTIVDMYSKCGSLNEACAVFERLPNQDAVSWCALIAGYGNHGHGLLALELFQEMCEQGIQPNRVAFLCTLKACLSIGSVQQGRVLHDQIIRRGLQSDMVVGNTLIDMYSKCESLEEARKVFDELSDQHTVPWGTMIAGYVMHGHCLTALKLSEKMQQEGVKIDDFIFSSILKACGSLGAIRQGRLIYNQILTCGLETDLVVGNALIDMHAKCGSLQGAWKVFDELAKRDVISWGTMIAAYATQGHCLNALKLFVKMQEEDVKPNKATLLCVLKACGIIGALGHGQIIHDLAIRSGFESDKVTGSTLVDVYTKFGRLEEAQKVFNHLQTEDVVSWGAMAAGYAHFGKTRLARQCLVDMQQRGLKPDGGIFTSLLAACGQAGLLEEGCQFFKCMAKDYGIIPSIEHYSCMIDLLGRAGCFIEAEDLLQIMPVPPDIVVWMSLLSSCKTYGNRDLGRQCFEHILHLDPSDASGYVLMSNIFADVHLWESVDKIQDVRKGINAKKQPGITWIEVCNEVCEFIVGGKSHPETDEIQTKLNSLAKYMKDNGYVPQLDTVLEPLSYENKEDALCKHGEKFSFNYGFVGTCEDESLCVDKNLEVGGGADRHNASKAISIIENKSIYIKGCISKSIIC